MDDRQAILDRIAGLAAANAALWKRIASLAQQVDTDRDSDFDRARQFVYDGFQIALEFEDPDGDGAAGSSLTNRYLWGAAVDQLLADERVDGTPGEAEDVLWALADHLGSVRDLAQYDSTSSETAVVNHRVNYSSPLRSGLAMSHNTLVALNEPIDPEPPGCQPGGSRPFNQIVKERFADAHPRPVGRRGSG